MVLAAGRGSRLRPLTDTLPKPLIELGGSPLIGHTLRSLSLAGVTEVAVNASHLADRLMEGLKDGADWGVRITWLREPTPKGTGGGLLGAEAWLRGEACFLVANGDTYLEIDWREFLAFHREGSYTASLALRDDPRWREYGALWRDSGGKIVSLLTPPIGTASAQPMVFAGAWVLGPEVFGWLRNGPLLPCLIRHGALPMHGAGLRLGGYATGGMWFDIGTPERLDEARRWFAAR